MSRTANIDTNLVIRANSNLEKNFVVNPITWVYHLSYGFFRLICNNLANNLKLDNPVEKDIETSLFYCALHIAEVVRFRIIALAVKKTHDEENFDGFLVEKWFVRLINNWDTLSLVVKIWPIASLNQTQKNCIS